MPLWSSDDPYGVATLRNVLLTFTVFLVVFGAYRSLVREDPYEYYVLAAAASLVLGLFMEKMIALFARGRGD